MKHISAPSIGIAWAEAYKLVSHEGHILTDGSKPAREVMNLFISIDNPQVSDKILDELADPEIIDWMVNKNFGGTGPIDDWGYSYGMRLRNFHGINQVDQAIKKLQKRQESK